MSQVTSCMCVIIANYNSISTNRNSKNFYSDKIKESPNCMKYMYHTSGNGEEINH